MTAKQSRTANLADIYTSTDIGDLVDKACHDLDHGQLIHNDYFTLWEAMSAIEIMDPKMDSGMQLDSQRQQQEFKLFTKLLPDEVLWIIDRTFACEMSWHAGNSLTQTIFTCLYLHHISDLTRVNFEGTQVLDNKDKNFIGKTRKESDPPGEFTYLVLKAHLVGLLRCCFHVWDEMARGNLYEEEDFVTNRFGLSLLSDVQDSVAINLLEDAEHWLSTTGRNWMHAANFDDIGEVLLQRIRLRKSFLLSFMYLDEPLCEDYSLAVKRLNECLLFIGKDKADCAISQTCSQGKEVHGAFDINIIRKLSSQAPPRPIDPFSTEEAAEKFRHLLKQSVQICLALEAHQPESILTFLFYFASASPPNFPYARSKLQTTIINDERILGKYSVIQFVRDAICQFVDPPRSIFFVDENGLTQDDLYHKILNWLQQTSRPYLATIKILCHNRSRQRRLLSKILMDWDLVQEEAEKIDTMVHMSMHMKPLTELNGTSHYPYFLSSWTFHMKLLVVEQILFLGFELDLYQPHEYKMIYWRLRHVLRVHYEHIERTAAHKEAMGDLSRKKGTLNESTYNRGVNDKVLATLTYYRNRSLALMHISEAMYMLLCGMEKWGWDPKGGNMEYDHEQARFEHRFKSLHFLASPAPLTYTDFIIDIKSTTHSRKLFEDAFKHVEAGLDTLRVITKYKYSDPMQDSAELCKSEQLQELSQLQQICVGLTDAIGKLRGRNYGHGGSGNGNGAHPSQAVCFEKGKHSWFPIIVINDTEVI